MCIRDSGKPYVQFKSAGSTTLTITANYLNKTLSANTTLNTYDGVVMYGIEPVISGDWIVQGKTLPVTFAARMSDGSKKTLSAAEVASISGLTVASTNSSAMEVVKNSDNSYSVVGLSLIHI